MNTEKRKWRRRESNPRPQLIHRGVYVCSSKESDAGQVSEHTLDRR